MREKKLAKNIIASLVNQIVTVVCGFILPRLMLKYFGSEVNGLLNSISQFLQIIAFLELGVGAVVQSALYLPLARKDNKKISQIITSATKFFRTIALALVIYIIILLFLYPYFTDSSFRVSYIDSLIIIMSISSLAQYYFGIVNRLLLNADQKGYIQYNTQTICTLLNTIMCIVLIYLHQSIQVVKLFSSIIFLIQPVTMQLYVRRHYSINIKESYEEEPITQKWNGIAQHVAAIILDGTDSIVLTLFATLSDVSVYSVYNLIIVGVKDLFMSLCNGIQSLLGELWAKEEKEELLRWFRLFEWVAHSIITILFGSVVMLIIPFISIYTSGVEDVNYIQPLFAILITLAHAGHCLRLPYNVMILAAGHYKETQSNYIIAAVLNIVISVLTVKKWGLVGVAIGTLVAMGYQSIWMAVYDSKKLFKCSMLESVKQLVLDILICVIGVFVTSHFKMESETYIAWFILAVKTFVVWLIISMILNFIFKKKYLLGIIRKVIYKIKGNDKDVA